MACLYSRVQYHVYLDTKMKIKGKTDRAFYLEIHLYSQGHTVLRTST